MNTLVLRVLIVISSCVCVSECIASGFFVRGDGKILLNRDEPFLKVGGDTVMMFGTASPNGLLCYVSRGDYDGQAFFPPYAFMKEINEASWNSYAPDLITMWLNIIMRDGELVKSIPIKQRYSTLVSHGEFIGERFVCLSFAIRAGGTILSNVVDIDSGEILTIPGDADLGLGGKCTTSLSPDGTRLAINACGQVFMGLKQIYPFYDPHPLNAAMSPEEYAEKKAVLLEWRSSHKETAMMGSDDAITWSPDGKYVCWMAAEVQDATTGFPRYSQFHLVVADAEDTDSATGGTSHLERIEIPAAEWAGLEYSHLVWSATDDAVRINSSYAKRTSHVNMSQARK